VDTEDFARLVGYIIRKKCLYWYVELTAVTERRMTMNATEARPIISPVQVGVILLTLVAGITHLYLFLIEGFLGYGRMLVWHQILFTGL
jgi:hypothetical protein